MEQARDIRNIALGAVNLTAFTPIRSSEVNTKFSSLKASIEALQAQLGVSRLAISRTTGNGKAVKLQAWNIAQHIGPMAQDFYVASRLNGTDSTHINAIDANGVAFAAIKGMYEKKWVLENQVKTLEARLAALEKAVRSR
jgi:hypothetical protein